jgi:hypothetical protein
MLPGDDGNSETAIIEFETREEALVAQTRDQKLLDDNAIEVHLGSGSTLFVTNFPSTADESYIRNLFREVGTCPTAPSNVKLTSHSMARLSIYASHLSNTTLIDDSVTCSSDPLGMPITRPS